MAKVKKTYRLDSVLLGKVQQEAENRKVSATEVLEDAIQNYFIASGSGAREATREPTAIQSSHTLQTLQDQLETQTEQLATLQAALDKAQQHIEAQDGIISEQTKTISTQAETISKQQETVSKQAEAVSVALLNAQTLNAADKAPALLEQPAESHTESPTPLGKMSAWQAFKLWRRERKQDQ